MRRAGEEALNVSSDGIHVESREEDASALPMCGALASSDRGPAYFPNVLLIGSTGRNSGKTELACTILRRLCRDQRTPARPVALKISTIHDPSAGCLRGRSGCGVCTSVRGRFLLTKETETRGGKDTQRLAAEGAGAVYWLRVKAPYLMEGFAAFASAVGANVPVICESNSVRTIVEPGLFVMMHPASAEPTKQSAQTVLDRADVTAHFGGADVDDCADRIFFDGRAFGYRYPSTAVVLAGGMSARMGRDKAMLTVNGVPMVQGLVDRLSPHFDEVLVSTAKADDYPFLQVRRVADAVANAGPLAGIAAGLAGAANEICVFVACDIPEIDDRLIRRLMRRARDHDAVVPQYADGRIEPALAVYKRRLLSSARRTLESGGRRIRDMYPGSDVCYLRIGADVQVDNINTLEDYQRYVCRRQGGI